MRIFQVCADRGIAPDGTKGASVHLRAVARHLGERGHEVVTLTVRSAADVDSFPSRLLPLRTDEDILAAATRWGVPDVIYERYSLGHEAGLAAARQLGRPFVLEVNAPLIREAAWYRPETFNASSAAAEERLLARADLVVCVSQPLADYVSAFRGKRQDNEGLAVVPNGCNPAHFPEPASLADDREIVTFLGHPKRWHGAERLAGLLSTLVGMGHDPRLLVIGGGPGADLVREAAEERGVGRLLEITGPLEQAAAARRLQDATVTIAPYPSLRLFYFCPLKVIESMAAGVPVVTSDQGDLPAIVGGGGLLVAPDDETALAAAVSRLLTDRSLRLKMGKAGRTRARSTYTWANVAGRLEGLFARLMDAAA